MELIFNKQAFMSVKEKMDAEKYIEKGETSKLNFKPTAPEVPTSQKTDKAIGKSYREEGEKGKLQYPKVKKEAGTIAGPGIPDGTGPRAGTPACPKSKATDTPEEVKVVTEEVYKEKPSMNKESAQQLPSSDSIDAGSVREEGDKGKLQFPTKPGPDPKIKMQGLDASNDARKQIDGGEKGKIQHGQTKGKDIKIDWQVNTDTSIGGKFMETGDKGDTKKVSGPAKDPGVSMQKDTGADKFIERGENTKPIQKQFNLNFKRASAEEKEQAVTDAIENAILEIEVAAAKCGVTPQNTRFAAVYTGLVDLRTGVKKNGSLYAITPEPKSVPAPLKVQAAAKPAVDEDAAAAEVGRRIF